MQNISSKSPRAGTKQKRKGVRKDHPGSSDDHASVELISYLSSFISPERLQRIETVLAERTRHVQVVVENIYQTHNASAILRSCECFGVQDVHVIEKEYAFNTNPDIVMGAEKWMTIHRSADTRTCLKQLKEKGSLIAATTLRSGAVPIDALSVERPLALVFGTEETGLSEEAHDIADVFVRLPMFGFTQSFNVSVSAALSLSHIMGRLRSSQVPWRLSKTEEEVLKLEWLMKSSPHGEALVRRWLENN